MQRAKFAGLFAAAALGVCGAIGCAADQPGAPAMKTQQMSVVGNPTQTTTVFKGVKANSGTVTATHQSDKIVLTWSDDFKIPDTPAPHWQVVDSKGNVYLLQRLKIKDDKLNRAITLPSYIHDVAKVQVWCAYAEVLLGEADFASPVM